MTNEYDTIVVGVGGMGSAALYHLARRGVDVLGIEQYGIPHTHGSSHGQTRLIRLAYAKDPRYVPLVERSAQLWEQLQRQSERDLLFRKGTLTGGIPGGAKVRGAVRSARTHDLEHEVYGGEEVNERFPGYRMPPEFEFVFQPGSGFLFAEGCIEAHVGRALDAGANLRTDESVREWRAGEAGVEVVTDRSSYRADRLVLTAGSWMGRLAPSLEAIVSPERQVLGWFETRTDDFRPEVFPAFDIEVPEGRYYGTPEFEVPGLKIGRFRHREEDATPGDMAEPTAEDERVLRECVDRYFPDGSGRCLNAETCMFTHSPDGDFVIDHHPDRSNVVVAGGFSGHGFKFASVVGEILADLTMDGRTAHDIDLFGATRFA